jgi:hypothetical protein
MRPPAAVAQPRRGAPASPRWSRGRSRGSRWGSEPARRSHTSFRRRRELRSRSTPPPALVERSTTGRPPVEEGGGFAAARVLAGGDARPPRRGACPRAAPLAGRGGEQGQHNSPTKGRRGSSQREVGRHDPHRRPLLRRRLRPYSASNILLAATFISSRLPDENGGEADVGSWRGSRHREDGGEASRGRSARRGSWRTGAATSGGRG